MFRFSIRDLIWLTLLVATSLGWWRYTGILEAQREARSQAFIQKQLDIRRADLESKAELRLLQVKMTFLTSAKKNLDQRREVEIEATKRALLEESTRLQALWRKAEMEAVAKRGQPSSEPAADR